MADLEADLSNAICICGLHCYLMSYRRLRYSGIPIHMVKRKEIERTR